MKNFPGAGRLPKHEIKKFYLGIWEYIHEHPEIDYDSDCPCILDSILTVDGEHYNFHKLCFFLDYGSRCSYLYHYNRWLHSKSRLSKSMHARKIIRLISSWEITEPSALPARKNSSP